jgi:hypothetical protein
MNSVIGWSLATLLVALAWYSYGWQGVLLAVSVVVFWLLLQFSRAMRAMRQAGQAPVGHVDSAVMLNAKLQPGMTMLQVIGLTKSLGRKLDGGNGEGRDDWAWSDEGGSTVTLQFQGGKLARFELDRPTP